MTGPKQISAMHGHIRPFEHIDQVSDLNVDWRNEKIMHSGESIIGGFK